MQLYSTVYGTLYWSSHYVQIYMINLCLKNVCGKFEGFFSLFAN